MHVKPISSVHVLAHNYKDYYMHVALCDTMIHSGTAMVCEAVHDCIHLVIQNNKINNEILLVKSAVMSCEVVLSQCPSTEVFKDLATEFVERKSHDSSSLTNQRLVVTNRFTVLSSDGKLGVGLGTRLS